MTLRVTSFVVLLAALPLLGGCSLLFVKGPPSAYEGLEYFPCTDSKTLPLLDVIAGGLSVVDIVRFVADDNPTPNPSANVAVSTGLAALFGFSAVVGFRRVEQCRAARLEVARAARQAALRFRAMDGADRSHENQTREGAGELVKLVGGS